MLQLLDTQKVCVQLTILAACVAPEQIWIPSLRVQGTHNAHSLPMSHPELGHLVVDRVDSEIGEKKSSRGKWNIENLLAVRHGRVYRKHVGWANEADSYFWWCTLNSATLKAVKCKPADKCETTTHHNMASRRRMGRSSVPLTDMTSCDLGWKQERLAEPCAHTAYQ